MLSEFYHDMHLVVYRDYANLSAGVTLLHIWAWEHIAVTRPLSVQDRRARRPYIDRYMSLLHYTWIGTIWFWYRIFYKLMEFT